MRVHACPCLLKSPSRYSQFNFLLFWTIGLLYFYTLLLNESTTYFWGHYRWHTRLIAGTKLGCIWQALHQERREDSNDCNAPTAGLQMADKVLGSHLGPVSYAYPIHIPSISHHARGWATRPWMTRRISSCSLSELSWDWSDIDGIDIFGSQPGSLPDGRGQCCHCPHVVCRVLGTGITVEWCKWSFVNLVGGLALLPHHSSILAGWSTACLRIWSYLVFWLVTVVLNTFATFWGFCGWDTCQRTFGSVWLKFCMFYHFWGWAAWHKVFTEELRTF